MLLYPNGAFGRLIVQRTGSLFFRRDIVISGLVLAAATAGIQILAQEYEELSPALPHHYGLLALGTVVGFAVVFRTNFSWQRYWEAVGQLHAMYSKWEDSYSQLLAFAAITIERQQAKGTEEAMAKCRRLAQTCDSALNMFSLLSAFAADRLMHGDTERMQKRLEVGKWRDQVVTRRELREGKDITGALRMPRLNASRRRSRSSQDCNDWAEETYNVSVDPPEALREILEISRERVSVVMYWVIHDLATAAADLDTPPPIQSRMYQELSNGMLGFNQALKIADVPFPFPFAQLLSLLLVCYVCFVPLYVVVFTQSLIVGPVMSFLIFQGIWSLNELAKELEAPFGTDVNDIPLEDFHQRFVDSCTDLHRAHMAKMQFNADPSTPPIRGSPARRPSLTSLLSRPNTPKDRSDSVMDLTKSKDHDAATGCYLPFSPSAVRPSILETSIHHSPLHIHCMGSSGGSSDMDEYRPSRTMSGVSNSFAVDMPKRPSSVGKAPPFGGIDLKEKDPTAGSRRSSFKSEDFAWREAQMKESMKVLNDQLVSLNRRIEQHLASIAADTRVLSEASRTLCRRRASRDAKIPTLNYEPPGQPCDSTPASLELATLNPAVSNKICGDIS